MPGGRPQEYDREQIAKNLIEWAKKEDSLNLNAFCTTHDPLIPPSYISIWAKETEQFSKAYETAKAFLAVRREKKLTSNELHSKAYDLNASVYDFFLREEKRREKEHEAELRKASENSQPQKVVFEVNYTSDKNTNDSVKVSSKEVSASDSPTA